MSPFPGVSETWSPKELPAGPNTVVPHGLSPPRNTSLKASFAGRGGCQALFAQANLGLLWVPMEARANVGVP